MKIPYHQTFVTQAPLLNIECWNLSNRRFDLPAGTRIHLDHEGGATQTVVTLVDAGGKSTHHPEHPSAYRFCPVNTELGKAIGLELPARTSDLVGDLMAYENGELDPEQAREFLTELRDSGLASKLQGHYGRACASL